MKFDIRAVREWVAGVLAGIYQPETDEEIWQWAERTMRIPSTENEEMAGMLWDSSMTAYVRPLMEWVKVPGKGEFWIKKSSQVGFTMAVLIIICWMIVHRPGNVAYAIDSVAEARNISKTRLKRWIEMNRLLDQVGETADAMSNLTFFLRGMTVFMLGAYSKGGWANKSITLFILDELDKHPYIEGEGSTVTLARERCKRPKNAKIIGFSTPGETDAITTEHAKGTREEHLVKMPCCGHEQALTWETFVFGTKEFRDLAGGPDREKVERDAHFKCTLCGGRLHDREKLPAIQAGRPVPTNPAANPRIRSLHIWDAYSPFVTFGQLALEWIDAQGDESLLERYFRGRRGEQFQRAGASLKTADVLKCVGGYSRGTVPFVPVLLCQAIDIQGDVQKAVKIAIDQKGDVWVIDWLITLQLSEAAEWAYENVTGPDGEVYQVTDGFIDDGHRAMEVRRMCLAHCPVFWPVKGRGGLQVREVVGTSVLYVDGEELLGYHIAEDQFKWQLLKMITDRDKRVKRGDLPILHLPREASEDDDFILELCNEIPQLKKNSLGKEKWEWKKLGDNDFWDCLKYCIALWYIKRPLLVREGATR